MQRWKQDKPVTRKAGRDNKLFLQKDVDSWDPASERGDEAKIPQLSAFLEHRAARTRPGTDSHIFTAHNQTN